MTWNYRIIQSRLGHYCLAEVFYDENQQIEGYSEKIAVIGDTKNDLIEGLELMLADAKKYPVLTEEYLEMYFNEKGRDGITE